MALSCSMGLCTPAIKTHELTALQSFRKLDVASRGRFARLALRRGELQITCVGWVCPLLSFPHELFFFPSSSLLFSRVKLPPERWIFICVDWIPFSPAAAPYILDTSRVILK
jgi:hypothetical protein